MNKKRLATIGSAALGLTIATGITSAYAAESFQPFFASEENRESLHTSIENGDYETWSALMDAQGDYIHDTIDEFNSQETFDLIQEAQELAESGDLKGAKELMNEASIPPMMAGARGHKGEGHGKRGGKHMSEEFKAVKEALANEDYDAWAAAMEAVGGRMADDINEEEYEHMLEVHELMEAGDKEGARELKKEWRESKMTDGEEANEGSEA